jgi:hypothetical protein
MNGMYIRIGISQEHQQRYSFSKATSSGRSPFDCGVTQCKLAVTHHISDNQGFAE